MSSRDGKALVEFVDESIEDVVVVAESDGGLHYRVHGLGKVLYCPWEHIIDVVYEDEELPDAHEAAIRPATNRS